MVVACVVLVVLGCVTPQLLTVKAETNQIYWGAFVGTTRMGYFPKVASFEAAVGKNMSIWNWIQAWNEPDRSDIARGILDCSEFNTTVMNQCRNNGMIPMVSWAPLSPQSDESYYPTPTLQDILNGQEDAYLTAWGQATAAWGHPFFVRLFWEFTGSWTTHYNPWSGYNSGAAQFVQAWQYVVNKVRAAGADNISWVWCPADVGDSVATLQSVYPGNNYVDWVATDVYPSQGQGMEPEVTNIHTAIPDKPMMLAEIGYNGNDMDSWWNNFLTNVLPNQYPYIKAVILWQDDETSGPSPNSPSFDVTNIAGFQKGVSSDYYSLNVYSNLETSPIPTLGQFPTPTSTHTNPTLSPTPTSTATNPTLSPTPTVPEYGQELLLALGVTIAIAFTISAYIKSKKEQSDEGKSAQ